MTMRQLLVFATLCCYLTSADVRAAQSGPSTQHLSGQDFAEIQDVLSRYAQGTDFNDLAMWLDIWASGAIFELSPSRRLSSRDELIAFFESQHRTPPKARHVLGSLVITPTADGATSRVYFVRYNVAVKPPAVTAIGYYEDSWVKTNAGWKIKTRRVHADAPDQ
jgi:hypothetical protein